MTSAATARSPALAAPELGEEARALFDVIYRLSFGRGDVILSSGKKSNYYFDMKPSMLDPRGAHLIAKGLLAEALAVGGEFIGGLEMGAVPITGAICQLSYTTGTPIAGFFVRKKAKDHGAKKLIEGLKAGETLRGKRVVIVEDVTTSGASALVALEACRQEGADVRLVVSVVDRCDGASEAFAEMGIPFKSLFVATDFLRRTD